MAAGLLGRERPRTLLTRRVVYSIYRHSFFGLNHIKYAKVDRIIAISRAIRDVLVEDGVAADRIEVVPSGIDRARLDVRSVDLRKEVGLPPETSVVVNVAHFAGHKGQRYLVEAAPRILAAQPDTAFFLVGEGEQQPEARSLARRLGVEDRVFFPGFRRDVPGILRGSDVYVTPSHREGLGTSLLDALWCGLPVVASAAGGQTEIVHDGDNGLLVPPQDSAALATATTRLLASSELRSRLGSAGPRVVEEHYTVEKMIEGNLAVYHELIAGAKPQLLPV
jgi:glycosyltransferase involved in cell wall biosynthesis